MVVSAASLQGKRDHQEDRWSVDAAASEGPVAFRYFFSFSPSFPV